MKDDQRNLEQRVERLEREVRRIRRLYDRTLSYEEEDPETALMHARKAAEAICRQIFMREISPNPGNLMLNDLIQKLVAQGKLPKKIAVPLRTIQNFGNYGTHDQDDDFDDPITSEYIRPCLSALAVVVKWYVEQCGGEESIQPTPDSPSMHPYEDDGTPDEQRGIRRHLPEPTMLDRQRILSASSQLRTETDFLGWRKGTLSFFAEVRPQHLNAPSNRYLFAHTTDARDQSGHPDSFSLCAWGTSRRWRLRVGQNPKTTLSLTLAHVEAMDGWRLFAVRWNRDKRLVDLVLDGGRWRVAGMIEADEDWPRAGLSRLRIGHYPSLYAGSEANTRVADFRLHNRWVPDSALPEWPPPEARP